MISACCTHVDDLVFCFAPGEEAEATREELRQKLNVGTWDKRDFTYTGREFSQQENGGIRVSMKAYIDGMKPARVSRERRAQPDAELTGAESTLLRSLVGQLTWVSRCLLPQISFPVSELAGHLAQGKVQHLVKAGVLHLVHFLDEVEPYICVI